MLAAKLRPSRRWFGDERDFTSERSEVKSRVSCTSATREGRACRGRIGAGPVWMSRAGDGPPGTSAPTIVPPAPTWPLPFSHPHPLGPYHCPTRTHMVPTILPPAPTSAPTIVPPAPTWPLPFSHPHPLGPLPFSHPHPLGPDVGSTTARRAKYPRRPRRGTPTLSHPMRPPHARPARRETPPKNLIFFVIEGCRWHTFMCRASRGYALRPIKQGESGVSGGVCAACIFGERTR